MLERAIRRRARYLARRGTIEPDDADSTDSAGQGGQLAASAVSGQTPPAGPQWLRGLRAFLPSDLAYDKPLCASLDGFTLHAATRAGAFDTAGREALLRYVLRPPVAQERVLPQKDGLIAITLKRAYADGTVAVERTPCRRSAGLRWVVVATSALIPASPDLRQAVDLEPRWLVRSSGPPCRRR